MVTTHTKNKTSHTKALNLYDKSLIKDLNNKGYYQKVSITELIHKRLKEGSMYRRDRKLLYKLLRELKDN